MRVGVVQLKAIKGNIEENITKHQDWINVAIRKNANLIVFPELSLTGYEIYVGKSGGYDCVGKSSAWDTDGKLIG